MSVNVDRQRVLVVHNHYVSRFPSGENSAVLRDLKYLRQNSIEFRTFFYYSDNFEKLGVAKKIAMVVSSLIGLRRKDIRKLIKEFQPTVIHVHNTFPGIGLGVLKIALKRKIKIVYTVHNSRLSCSAGSHFRKGNRCQLCVVGKLQLSAIRYGCFHGSVLASSVFTAYQYRFTHLIKRASKFIVLNDYSKRQLNSIGVIDSKILLKKTGYSGQSLSTSARTKTFLYAGRLTEEKGVRIIVDAWLKASASNRGWRILFCGNGDLSDYITRQAEQVESLVFRGNLSEDELGLEVSTAYRVLVPSLTYEGFPTMISMAASLGTPVVFSDNPSLNDLSDLSWCTKIQASERQWQEYFDKAGEDIDSLVDRDALDWWSKNASDSANARVLMLAYDLL